MPQTHHLSEDRHDGAVSYQINATLSTFRNTHPTDAVPRCPVLLTITGENGAWTTPVEYPLELHVQRSVLSSNDQHRNLRIDDVNRTLLTQGNGIYWPHTSHNSLPSSRHLQSLSEPCPQITQPHASGLYSNFLVTDGFSSPTPSADDVQQTHKPNNFVPSMMNNSPFLTSNDPESTQKVSCVVNQDLYSSQFDAGASSSTELPSQPRSSQPHDRPHQRRRTAHPTPSLSSLNEAENASDSSFTTASSIRHPNPRPRKANLSNKRRVHRTQTSTSTITIGAFSTFSVDLVSSDHEPTGATYMSTVNFDNEAKHEVFEHGPTDLPPRPYIGGAEAGSPWKPRRKLGSIPGSALDYLPILEYRIARLERAISLYLERRGERAVQNSIVPGMDLDAEGNTNAE